MTYENAIESLEKSLVFGIKPGMQRIKNFWNFSTILKKHIK